MANVGKQIKKLRTAKRMTQDQLADCLFVSRQTVSNYEMGKSNPDIDMLVKIAEVFETDVNTLIYGPPVPPDQKRQRSRTLILLGITLLLGSIAILETLKLPELLCMESMSAPLLMTLYLTWPALKLLLGWTIIEFAGSFLCAKRMTGEWVRWLRWGLVGVLAVYAVVVIPDLWETAQMCVKQQISRDYLYGNPWYNSHNAFGWQALRPILFLVGAGGWLTGSPRKESR